MGAKSNQGAPASGNSMSVVNTGPWAPQQPYLEGAFKEAQTQYDANKKAAFYPGQTVASTNPNQNWGRQSVLEQANRGQPNLPAAETLNLDTLSGRYLDPASNPWLSKTFGAAADDVSRAYQTSTAPTTAANFAGLGRYGSPSYRLATENNERSLGGTLNNLATNIYGGNYQAERGRQMDAVGQVPMLQSAKYVDPMAIMNVGDQQQQQTQREYDDSRTRYEYGRDNPTRALNSYLAQITGNYGQSGTNMTMQGSSTPYYTNPGATAAGGAMGLASLFGRGGPFSGMFGGGKGGGGIDIGGSGTLF